MRIARRQRGFTLIELIISMAIVLLAISLAGAGFIAQNQALQASDLHRQANSSNRDALLMLEQTLRMTGWGVDPRFAIDVTSSFKSVDRTTVAPYTDELTVISRNPLYQWVDNNATTCPATAATIGGCWTGNAWRIDTTTNPSTGVLRITLATGQKIEKGRLLQVMCLGGENPVILTASNNFTGPGTVNVSFSTTDSWGSGNHPYNATASLQTSAIGCHAQPGVAVYLLDRSRFFIQNYTDATGVSVPWLMMDPTLDADGDGTISGASDMIPVAKNIEDFQVAYLLPTHLGAAQDDNNDYIIGNTPGVVELPAAPGSATAAPLYTTALNDSTRATTNAANVKAIRVSIITRSARQDPNRPLWPGDSVPWGENRTGPAATTPTGANNRWLRFPSTSEITLRNMDSQRPFTF